MKHCQPLEKNEKDGLLFLRAPALSRLPVIEHAFMTREGGVSPAPFNTLNLGHGPGDGPLNIRANMERIAVAFGLDNSVFTVRQVHGKEVVVLKTAPDMSSVRPEADAIVTAAPGIAIGVLTADCVPVLMCDPSGGAIAAVHAGWRGLVAGVIEEAFSVMTEDFGARAGDCVAAIGPHIGPCCYEVSEDLVARFRDRGMGGEIFFNRNDGALHLDLGCAVLDVLLGMGILPGNINGPGPCTACDEKKFFSYRRDGRTGRQMSFIMIR